jgi:cobalt-zinc-cadmium efflux system protein
VPRTCNLWQEPDGEAPDREHPHGSSHGHLTGALLLTLLFALVELSAGIWSGSLALISDSGHILTVASALALATIAAWLARKPPSGRHAYGLMRAEILAAPVVKAARAMLLVRYRIGHVTLQPEEAAS